MRTLTDDERALMQHVSMWGSDGYPIRQLSKGRWIWDNWRGVRGTPVIYKTKREATEAFERFMDVLRETYGAVRQREAMADAMRRQPDTERISHDPTHPSPL